MADTGGPFEGDHGNTATSFSQLLFADDVILSLDMDQTFTNCSCYPTTAFSAHEKPRRMLCFGNHRDGEVVVYGETTTTTTARSTPQKSGVTCSDSSSASSGNNSSVNITHSKSNKKRNGSTQQSVHCSSSMTTTPVANQRTSKKTKADNNPSSTGHAKVRKEKIGERITALQQLVSPFGKTDTASVLHEAMGYIRFLHDQVQVLCSPYLQHHLPEDGENGGDEETSKDLKSRGLCLVPLACTIQVASSNGADFWSPAMGSNVS